MYYWTTCKQLCYVSNRLFPITFQNKDVFVLSGKKGSKIRFTIVWTISPGDWGRVGQLLQPSVIISGQVNENRINVVYFSSFQ